jgi:hypothetical protein
MTQDRRSHPRFEITPSSPVEGSTDGGASGEKMISLGLGGCAFIAHSQGFDRKEGDLVRCHIRLGAERTVSVEGRIVYVLAYPFPGEIGRCYGVQFSWEDELLGEIVRVLESTQARQIAR